MKIAIRLAALTLSTGLLFTAAAHAQYAPPQGPPPPGYQDGGWEGPPPEYQDEIRRQGFHDGIEGARKDYGNHRAPNVNNRDEYRHPNVPRRARREYRNAFWRGYQVGVQHLIGGSAGPPLATKHIS